MTWVCIRTFSKVFQLFLTTRLLFLHVLLFLNSLGLCPLLHPFLAYACVCRLPLCVKPLPKVKWRRLQKSLSHGDRLICTLNNDTKMLQCDACRSWLNITMWLGTEIGCLSTGVCVIMMSLLKQQMCNKVE